MSARTVNVLRTRDDRVIPVAGVYDIDGAHTSVDFGFTLNMALETGGTLDAKVARIELAVEAIAASEQAVG
jgi:hypothetical protein